MTSPKDDPKWWARKLVDHVSTATQLDPEKGELSNIDDWRALFAQALKHRTPGRQAMSRPTFDSIYMRLAHMMAERSSCSRLKVGAVITSPDHRKVIAVGYNGGAVGQDNECESDAPGQCGHLHAEENAIINCDVPRGLPKLVYVTHLPCPMCAKRLVNLGGVQAVYFQEDYRVRDAAQILGRAQIPIIHKPAA